MDPWGRAKWHWQTHLPDRYRVLEDPMVYFTQLGGASARYEQDGVSPNNGTIGWAEFQNRVAQAEQTAREMVETELIYLPPG